MTLNYATALHATPLFTAISTLNKLQANEHKTASSLPENGPTDRLATQFRTVISLKH
jgi:hypothetical protein